MIEGGALVWGARMPIVKMRGKAMIDARRVAQLLEEPFDVAVIEAVHAMPRQGVSSSFQFGRMLGGIEALVYATGARVEYVTPAAWKKALGLSTEKQASIDAAKIRFGSVADEVLRHKADDGIAEAALIAAYWSSTC
jgi:crossover junction endodeoxyribonuclease RuvC